MRVYHLSSAPFTGGAARAAFRLHLGLLARPEVGSLWLDAGGGAKGPGVQNLPRPGQPSPPLKRLRRRYWGKVVSREFAPASPPASNPVGWGSAEMLARLPVPDVWNLHWVSWFLDWETLLPWMAERAPIVWTLHDLNPLKGIWHYDGSPEECTPERVRWEAKAMELKRRALSRVPRDRLIFVGPSRWMVERCRKSPVTAGFAVEHIPYGLQTEVFTPRDPQILRSMFGIPAGAFVIGFIADHLNDPRKGMKPLGEALAQLGRSYPEAHLVTVGNGSIPSGGLPHTHLGPLQNDHLLSFFYSGCDVFVCPSLQDNLPNTVLESMACGTPVIGYDVGGIPDMVLPGRSGYLAEKPGDGATLVGALLHGAAMAETTRSMRAGARETAVSRFGLEGQAKKYLALYSLLMSGNTLQAG